MKAKRLLYLALVFTLLGCSLFSQLGSSQSEPGDVPEEQSSSPEVSTVDWTLSDPAAGLAALESYHQQLTISFRGTQDGAAYEWNNTYERDVWAKPSASFTFLTMNETGGESSERLSGSVGQAKYSRSAGGDSCQVKWIESVSEGDAEPALEPASFLPPIQQAAEEGIETVNNVPARRYVLSAESSDRMIDGEYWLAEPGGYLVRYLLVISGGEKVFGEGREGEQRYEYELSEIDARMEVVYPEGCAPVVMDFPVMDGARGLQRLPESVDYTVSAEIPAVSQFYQDELTAQGWTLASVHDKDPENVVLVFGNPEKKLSGTILLSTRPKGVWVSAIVRAWEPTSGDLFEPEE